jgi:hypothetical protein
VKTSPGIPKLEARRRGVAGGDEKKRQRSAGMGKGMKLLLKAGAEAVEVFGDSKLVFSQLTVEYKCESESLFPLWMQCRELITQFRYINFYWIPRSQNAESDDLAQKASGYKAITGQADFSVQFLELGDWRADIFNYLKDPARGHLRGCDTRP